MSLLLLGKPAAQAIEEQISDQLSLLEVPPLVTIIQIGHNPASDSYIARKIKKATSLSIDITHLQLEDATTTSEICKQITQLNNDSTVTGILVQLPLPAHIDTDQVLETISPMKDVDGLTPINLGRLMAGNPYLVSATAEGVVALLDYYHIALTGKLVTVIGRSRLVGQPLAQLLLVHGATITIAHSKTPDISGVTKNADIIIAAVGSPDLITGSMVKDGATVIDVGLTKTDQGMRGDVDKSVSLVAGAVSPVPGGVGPLTVACLMRNVLKAAQAQAESPLS